MCVNVWLIFHEKSKLTRQKEIKIKENIAILNCPKDGQIFQDKNILNVRIASIPRDFLVDSRLLARALLCETFPNADVTLFLGGDNRDRVADALLYLLNNAPGTFGVNIALSIHHFIKIGLV